MSRFPVEPPIRVPPIRLRVQAGAWRLARPGASCEGRRARRAGKVAIVEPSRSSSGSPQAPRGNESARRMEPYRESARALQEPRGASWRIIPDEPEPFPVARQSRKARSNPRFGPWTRHKRHVARYGTEGYQRTGKPTIAPRNATWRFRGVESRMSRTVPCASSGNRAGELNRNREPSRKRQDRARGAVRAEPLSSYRIRAVAPRNATWRFRGASSGSLTGRLGLTANCLPIFGDSQPNPIRENRRIRKPGIRRLREIRLRG